MSKPKEELCQICDEVCESKKRKERVYKCNCNVPICNECLASWAVAQLNEQL